MKEKEFADILMRDFKVNAKKDGARVRFFKINKARGQVWVEEVDDNVAKNIVISVYTNLFVTILIELIDDFGRRMRSADSWLPVKEKKQTAPCRPKSKRVA
eukprot:scaffold15596_cov172-Alexandrium_tamarense.AAC.1